MIPYKCGLEPRLQSGHMTVDVWMQHPTVRFLNHEMLASLRRWTGGAMPEKDSDVPIEATVASMDAAGVDFGLLSAWRGPNGLDLTLRIKRAVPDRRPQPAL